MRFGIVIVSLVFASLLAGCGSDSKEASATAKEVTPLPKVRDATASDNAKAIASNPNLSPEVKHVLGGAGK